MLDLRTVDRELQLIDLDRADAEESLYVFLKNAWHIWDSAPWVDGWCVDAMAEHLQAVVDGQIKRLIINIPPRCSKPVEKNTLISTLERGVIPLHKVFAGLHVLTHKGRFRRVTAVHIQGLIHVLKLTTRSGRQVVSAPDHPFLTTNGWMDLHKIKTQEVVGTIPQYIPSGTKTVSAECARLLGYLVGDGTCKGTPNITVADDIEAEDIRQCIDACGFNSVEQSYHMANTGYLLRRIVIKSRDWSRKGMQTLGLRGPVRQFMTTHELWGGSSYTKKIPTCIMEGDDEIVKNFIGAYWACDGFIQSKGAKRDGTERDDLHIGCDSVNLNFMLQMQVLLLRLGISSILRKKISKIKTKKQGDIYTSYSITISDQDNCWRFAMAIKIIHTKGLKLEKARKRRFDFDQTIRGEVVEEIIPYGEAECICLTVEEDESFVANGFAVHNSALCSVAFPAWTWAQPVDSHTSGPGVSFLFASFREDLSRRDSLACRKIIESKWYRDRWSTRYDLSDDQNTKSRFNNTKGGFRLITSIESKGATGDGSNIIVLDDCNSAKEVESEAIIESTLDWFDGTLGTRLNNQKLGAVIEIQQRLGENDMTGHILSKSVGDWVHLCLPMRYEPERSFHTIIGWKDPRTVPGQLLWPERFGEPEVKGLETWMGPWRAAGQLQQRPEPRGGGVIKREWWKLWERKEWPPMDYIIGCLDTAYTLATMNDPSGMIVWGIFSGEALGTATTILDPEDPKRQRLIYIDRSEGQPSPKAMLCHAWTERYEFHELIKKVVATAKLLKIDLLLIENKAAGISVAQEIRRLYSNEKFGVQLFDPKSQDKFARLVSVQHLFQEGLIYAPDTKFAEDVITQVGQFPRAKHDEYVDLTSMGLRHLRDGGLLTRLPERMQELEESKRFMGRNQAQPLYPV